MRHDPRAQLAEDATWILDAWPALHASRLKGTPRPWRQTDLTPEARAELDAAAKAEKLENNASTFGESPAPLHLDVHDLLHKTAHTAWRAATWLTLTTIGPHPAMCYPDQLLTYIRARAHLATDGEALNNHARQIRARRVEIAKHFAEVVDGQRLKATCPWCLTDKLYFRAIGPETNHQIVVRCDSGTCQPPEGDCGTWMRGRPCWPFHEWEWLAARIDHHQAGRAWSTTTPQG